MPRIKVYKSGSDMIPVEGAVIKTAFRCPWTQRLFPTKSGYVKHLRELRETRMHRRARAKRRDRKFQQLWNLNSFEEIIEWIELNPEVIFEATKGSRWTKFSEAELREKFRVQLTYMDVGHSERVSNTHSAPHGKPQNWGREPGKPTGYPGWSGRIEFRVLPENCGISGSDVGRVLRMHTGTGGGIRGGYYGYDVRMFEEDWPGLSGDYAEQCVMAKLSDQKMPGWHFKHGVKRY